MRSEKRSGGPSHGGTTVGRHLVSRFIYFRDDSRRARNLFARFMFICESEIMIISGMFSMLPSPQMSRRCSDLRRQIRRAMVAGSLEVANQPRLIMARVAAEFHGHPGAADGRTQSQPCAHGTRNHSANLIYSGQLYRTKNIYFRRDLSSSQTLHMTLIPFLFFLHTIH